MPLRCRPVSLVVLPGRVPPRGARHHVVQMLVGHETRDLTAPCGSARDSTRTRTAARSRAAHRLARLPSRRRARSKPRLGLTGRGLAPVMATSVVPDDAECAVVGRTAVAPAAPTDQPGRASCTVGRRSAEHLGRREDLDLALDVLHLAALEPSTMFRLHPGQVQPPPGRPPARRRSRRSRRRTSTPSDVRPRSRGSPPGARRRADRAAGRPASGRPRRAGCRRRPARPARHRAASPAPDARRVARSRCGSNRTTRRSICSLFSCSSSEQISPTPTAAATGSARVEMNVTIIADLAGVRWSSRPPRCRRTAATSRRGEDQHGGQGGHRHQPDRLRTAPAG